MKRLLFSLIFLFALSVLADQPGTLRPIRPKCESSTNPLGVDVLNPQLGWQSTSDHPGDCQTAWQVVVENVWDSGKVESDQSVGIRYNGKPLQAGQRYSWKVRVWDQNGRPSEWSAPATWIMGKLSPSDWSAQWIGFPSETDNSSKRPTTQPPTSAPWFRRNFELPKTPESAIFTVNSPCYFELYVNGEKVSPEVLTPAVSDLSQQTFSLSYDVTQLLHAGKNSLGFWLGAGWSNQLLFRAQLDALIDGKPFVLGTDATWKTRPSGYSHIGKRTWNNFGGERVDAGAHLANWAAPDLDETGWSSATELPAPQGKVNAQICPPNRIGERIPAVKVTPLGEGRYEIDFGKNLTGWLSLRMPQLAKGAKAVLYFADVCLPGGVSHLPIEKTSIPKQSQIELPAADGTSNTYQIFKQVSEFISGGNSGESFQHKFNYAGFRYVIVEGLPSAPAKEDASALLVESALDQAGSFECSDPLLNRIHQANEWTLRCLSLGGYMVDCPHRERMGYGDGQVSTVGMMMGFDAARFYQKWVGDWRQTQKTENGAMPNTAPWGIGGGGPPWPGVIAMAPWEHYLHYGNTKILEDNYQPARRYVEYLDSRAENEVLRAWGKGFDFLGDWVPPGRGMDTKNWPNKEMAELFCNCYRITLWDLVGKTATALGRPEEAKHAQSRVDAIRPAVHAAFFDPENKRYVIDEQIYYVMPLLTGVTPESERDAVMKNLVRCLTEKNKGHLDTGMLGTLFLIDFLNQAGRDDLVLNIYQKKEYPGWGFMVEQGATTLWEQWNGFWSHIHSCFASADNWLYRGLAGIRPDPQQPGFKNVIIKPAIVGDITWVKAHHDGPYGRIVSEWKREGNNLSLSVTIPPNSTATIHLPGKSAPIQVGSGQHQFQSTIIP